MWKSRLCYLLVLLCTSVFFICYNGYISMYVFVLSLLFPVFALLLSLPGILGLRVELLAGREGPGASLTGTSCARKGEAIPLQLAVWNATPFSSGRVQARLTVVNTFTGQREEERFSFTAGPRREWRAQALGRESPGVHPPGSFCLVKGKSEVFFRDFSLFAGESGCFLQNPRAVL